MTLHTNTMQDIEKNTNIGALFFVAAEQKDIYCLEPVANFFQKKIYNLLTANHNEISTLLKVDRPIYVCSSRSVLDFIATFRPRSSFSIIGMEHGLAPFKSYTYDKRLLDFDLYFAPTQAWKDRLINIHRPSKNNVQVVGYPRLDQLKALNDETLHTPNPITAIWEKQNVSKKLVIFSWGVSQKVLSELPDIEGIVYLLHPADEYLLKGSTFKKAHLDISSPTLTCYLVKNADIVFGDFSSMTIEAQYLGAKVIIFICKDLYRCNVDLPNNFFEPSSEEFAHIPHFDQQILKRKIITNITLLKEILSSNAANNSDMTSCFSDIFYPPTYINSVEKSAYLILNAMESRQEKFSLDHYENQNTYRDLISALEFIIYAYRIILHRNPDLTGIKNYITAYRHFDLKGPAFAFKVLLSLSESKEYTSKLAANNIQWPTIIFNDSSSQVGIKQKSDSLYNVFSNELNKSFKDFGYAWDHFKEDSCNWILDKIPKGKGVDVGGTSYLVKKIQSIADVTYFDLFPPQDKSIDKFITADMIDFGNFFEKNSLDFIITRHTLEHSLNPLFQLWQYNRTLNDNGRLIVVVPFHNKGWVWFYSHFSCLPYENWLMLFYRSGFKLLESSAGTWQPHNPDFIEYRFVLQVETRNIRLENSEYKDFRI